LGVMCIVWGVPGTRLWLRWVSLEALREWKEPLIPKNKKILMLGIYRNK
jgi:hypothetical protein